jgi:hypothetical protein
MMNFPVPDAPFFSSERLPAARVSPPEKVLEPDVPPITKRPVPSFVKVAEAPPETSPESVILSVLLFAEKVCKPTKYRSEEIESARRALVPLVKTPNRTPDPRAKVPPEKVRAEFAVL